MNKLVQFRDYFQFQLLMKNFRYDLVDIVFNLVQNLSFSFEFMLVIVKFWVKLIMII